MAWIVWCVALLARAVPARRQAAQGLAEYAIILVLIAIVVIGGVTMTGRRISSTYTEVDCTLARTTCTADGAAPAAPTPCVESGNSGICAPGRNGR